MKQDYQAEGRGKSQSCPFTEREAAFLLTSNTNRKGWSGWGLRGDGADFIFQ